MINSPKIEKAISIVLCALTMGCGKSAPRENLSEAKLPTLRDISATRPEKTVQPPIIHQNAYPTVEDAWYILDCSDRNCWPLAKMAENENSRQVDSKHRIHFDYVMPFEDKKWRSEFIDLEAGRQIPSRK